MNSIVIATFCAFVGADVTQYCETVNLPVNQCVQSVYMDSVTSEYQNWLDKLKQSGYTVLLDGGYILTSCSEDVPYQNKSASRW